MINLSLLMAEVMIRGDEPWLGRIVLSSRPNGEPGTGLSTRTHALPRTKDPNQHKPKLT